MKCFDCGSTKHLAFHRECPAHIERMKKRSGILDGVRKQLNKGYKPSEILACLASASDESLAIRDDENSDATSEIIEVEYSLNQNNITESESEDDLFGTAFERSLSHRMENHLCYDPGFRNGSAN